MARKIVRIDARALAAAGASSVLALEARALGGTVALARSEQEAGEVMAVADEAGGGRAKLQSVGVVRVEGPLSQRALADLCGYVDGYDAIEARLSLALDSDVGGVLMVIDSPGGEAAGLEEAVRRMRGAVEKSGKRVVAYVDELAASAAYWIASGVADEIVVPAAGHVGSIGTIGALVDMTGAAEQAGEKWTIVRDPAGKAPGHPMGPVSEVAEERLRGEVKAATARFVKAVSKRRGIPSGDIRKMDGALFSGADAVAAGLADRVGTLEQAARAALAPRNKDDGREGAAPKGETKMKLLAAVCAALGLDADTSEADAVEAFQGATSAILAASGAKKLGKAAAAIEALTENRDALAEKAGRVDSLAAELAAIKAEKAEGEKVAAVERILAAASNKVSPAKRAQLAEKGLRNGAEWLQSVVDELPVLIGAEPPKPADQSPQAASDELKPREVAMCAQLGIDPKTYAAQKAALLKKAG
jgi:ClpP class serine protease